jgi:hypothetical protein
MQPQTPNQNPVDPITPQPGQAIEPTSVPVTPVQPTTPPSQPQVPQAPAPSTTPQNSVETQQPVTQVNPPAIQQPSPAPVQAVPAPAQSVPPEPQVQQPVGFVPAGFDQAHFAQDPLVQSAGVAPVKKKSIFANKIFIASVSVFAFAAILGGAYAFNTFWVEDKSEVLINFGKTDNLRHTLRSKVSDRIFVNTGFANSTYNVEDEKLRHAANLKLLENTNAAIAKYDESVDDYNSIRDRDFAKLATEYSTFIKKCVDFTGEINEDLHVFGPHMEKIRVAAKKIGYDERSFKDASDAQQLKLIKQAQKDYVAIKSDLAKEKFKTSEIKEVQKVMISMLDTNLAELNDIVKVFGSDTFFFIGDATKFFNQDLTTATTSISTQFNDGICWSDADDKLGEIFDEFDFSKEDKEILKTFEILE